jgi:hypothetical protein
MQPNLPETDRHLAAILLDLSAAQAQHKTIDERLFSGGVREARDDEETRDNLGKRLDGIDTDIERLRDEAKSALLRDTGVAFEHIAEANL